MKFTLLATSMLLAVAGQLSLKSGVKSSKLQLKIKALIDTLLAPPVILGFFLYGASAIIWLFVLKEFPLSVAYPSLSLTYVLIVILSRLFFDEPITKNKLSGIPLIIVGVILLFS